MNIGRIARRVVRLPDGAGQVVEPVVVIGEAQGYLALPVRVGFDNASGLGTMTTAWEPTPAELAALNAGAMVHVQLLGQPGIVLHPPISVIVGEAPEDYAGP